MTVSVRMNPLLERELEVAAKQRGVSKSQFIVQAVQRALGQKDPYALLLKLQAGAQACTDSDSFVRASDLADEPASSTNDPLRRKLMTKQDESMIDWLAYQAAKKQGKAWTPEPAQLGAAT